MNEDIYGSVLYYYLDIEYLKNDIETNSLRLDELMNYFDDPGVFVILNRIEETVPSRVSSIDSNFISTVISRSK